MNPSKKAGEENLYHIVARNDKTGVDHYLTATPMTHHECMTMKNKLRLDSESRPHVRTLLVESTRKTDSYAKAGIGPAPSRKNPRFTGGGFTEEKKWLMAARSASPLKFPQKEPRRSKKKRDHTPFMVPGRIN
jgi:hypothetical protein